MIRYLLFIWISVGLTTCAQSYTLSGSVTAADTQETLLGVTVYAQSTALGTVTNNYGVYSLTLPQGDYRILFQNLGFETKVIEVSLDSDQALNVSLALKSEELDEVIVTEDVERIRLRAPEMSVNRLSSKSIQQTPRLKKLVMSIKPKGFGVIIRTVAEGKKVAELDKDLQDLYNRWVGMCKKIQKADYPSRVLSELNRASSILRDIFDDGFTGIHVDDPELLTEVKEYLGQIASDRVNIAKLFKSEVPIFEHFGIERQIKASFGRTVSMNRGAYLIIEHTEALHVIDVNSGNRSNKAKNQEDTALEVNMIAASEIARQLRLRDMGGIIVVDFIDMIRQENRKKLFEHFRKEMESDRAKHKILPPSRIGLIQMTRQRVRPEMDIKTTESNPNINGEVEAPIVLIDKIKADLEKILANPKHKKKKIVLHLHPFIAAYVAKGWKSDRMKWYFEYNKWVKVVPRDAYTYLHYRFFDGKGKVIHV